VGSVTRTARADDPGHVRQPVEAYEGLEQFGALDLVRDLVEPVDQQEA
jgi:hypothetical protein